MSGVLVVQKTIKINMQKEVKILKDILDRGGKLWNIDGYSTTIEDSNGNKERVSSLVWAWMRDNQVVSRSEFFNDCWDINLD